jgi:23S rRNA (uracil1939-C5)-methyltransferase
VLGACDVAITSAQNGLDVAVKAERKVVPRRLDGLREISTSWQLARLAINGEAVFTVDKPMVSMGRAHVPLPIGSFLQATQAGEEILSQLVLDGLSGSRHVVDLFCGAGPFALRLAERVKVFAVDTDKPALAALQQAARQTQGLKPIVIEVRNLFRAPLIASELNDYDGIVFDPPRAGAEAQARQIAASRVKRVVAVACDVQTFARDAAILISGGYRLKEVVPVDQFKWTAHLEVVGIFER